jgi:hypothetical protein
MTAKEFVISKIKYAKCFKQVKQITDSFLLDRFYLVIDLHTNKIICQANNPVSAWKQAKNYILNQ